MPRIAVAQLRLGKDTDRILQEMLHLIEEAAEQGADLVHFQECCNYPTLYDSREHAWREAITVPGPMLDAILRAASRAGLYVSFNASVRGDFPNAYMVNHLVGPDGTWIGGNKKQVLMWEERDAFVPSDVENEVFQTAIGRIGLMSCMDGLVPETARTLAVKGAQIILNSLCSNGLDEAHTHVPARAAENGVFMVAANRIGDMVVGEDLERLKRSSGMDRERLLGAGESQIVGPDGQVIARASKHEFGITVADIDLEAVSSASRLAGRRPECYALIASPNESLAGILEGRPAATEASISTIAVAGERGFDHVLAETARRVATAPVGLVVLPELFAWKIEEVIAAGSNLADQIRAATRELAGLAESHSTYIVAGLPGEVGGRLVNQAVLFGPSGVVGRYDQVHRDPVLDWNGLGNDFPVFDLPFGRLGMLLGHDLLYPEAARVLARKGADVIACPSTWRSEWQFRLIASERSAENHLCLAAAARLDSPYQAPSIIYSTPTDYRFAETAEVNMPDRWTSGPAETTLTVLVDLTANRDKRLMRSTDLIMDVAPRLYGSLVTARAAESTA